MNASEYLHHYSAKIKSEMRLRISTKETKHKNQNILPWCLGNEYDKSSASDKKLRMFYGLISWYSPERLRKTTKILSHKSAISGLYDVSP